MNKERRKALTRIEEKIEALKDEVESLMGEEAEYRDNIPENMQGSERYEIADAACENMQSAIDSMEEALSCIWEAQA